MSASSLSITFHLEIFGRHVTLSRTAAATDLLGSVALSLLKETGIGDSLSGWEMLREEGDRLSPEQKIGDLVRASWSGVISVTLRLAVRLPERPPSTADRPAVILPGKKKVAPATQHDMRIPDPNEKPTLPDINLPDVEVKKPTSNGRPGDKPGAKKPGSVIKPGLNPPSAVKPAAKPPSTVKPALKPPSTIKPGLKPPSSVKPGVSLPPAQRPVPPPPPGSAPSPRSTASRPPAPPPAPAARMRTSEDATPPPAKKTPPTRVKPGVTLPEPDGKPKPLDLTSTDFDIPPVEVAKPVAAAPARSQESAAAIELLGKSEGEEVEYGSEVVSVDEEADDETDVMRAARSARSTRRLTKPAPAATRRATVRYYNRMNPQRVFPFLVVISKEMIERAAKAGTDQRQSRPFKVELDSPVEIEPVLPGCYCYPPKATARLSGDDMTFTFHVVPHVLGEVTGACVRVRQDHAELAAIDLDIRVVQRTWMLFSGALTLGLPFGSALLRHFHVDLTAPVSDPNNIFVIATNFLVNHLPPLGLMGGLAVVTLLLYWLSRSHQRDAFFEIKPTGATEKLRRIEAEMEKNSNQAADDLLYLLEAHPNHQRAWLLFADWHFRLGNWREATDGYDRAFRLGRAEPRHYMQATRSALSLQEVSKALHMLYRAKASLSAENMASPEFVGLWDEARKAEVPA